MFARLLTFGHAVRAGESMLDQFLGRLCLRDAPLELVDVVAQQIPVFHRVRGGQHRCQLPQRETSLLAHQDQRHAFEVRLLVQPLATVAASRLQQPEALPVPQHVCAEPEPPGQIADGQHLT